MIKPFSFFSALLLLSLTPAFAQSTVQPGVIDRNFDRFELPEEDLTPQSATDLGDVPLLKDADDSKPATATINSISFTGDYALPEAKMQAIAAPYIGSKMTAQDLAELKFNLEKLYYDAGYVLTKAITPPQNVADGELEIKVISARIGTLSSHDEENILNDTITKTRMNRLKEGEYFNERSAETVAGSVNSLPDIAASIILRPSTQFGHTDPHLILRDADEETQEFTIDNYGNELTGRTVATLRLEKNNLLKLGEEWRATLRRSNGDLWSAALGATIPLPLDNLRLEIDGLLSENEIGDRLAALNASGETQSLTVALSGDIINNVKRRYTLRAGMEARHHESFLSNVTSNEDDVRRAFIESTTLHRFDAGHLLFTSMRVSKGLSVFGASEEGDAGLSRANSDPEAWIFRPTVAANLRVHPKGMLNLLAQAQWASETLLSSDLFVIGGYGNVRGFEPAESTGESGYQLSAEYLHNIRLSDNWLLRVGPTADMGRVLNRTPGNALDDTLYSAGLAAEAYIGNFFLGKQVVVRADYAETLGDYDSPTVDNRFFYVRVGLEF